MDLGLTEEKKARLHIALNMMYIATDIADRYATEAEYLLKHIGRYKNQDKQSIKRIKALTNNIIKSVDHVLSPKGQEMFGDDSDFLKEVIEIAIKSKTEEDNIKILSTLKMLVK